MSAENNICDVSVSYYHCTQTDSVYLKFYNDTEQLIGERAKMSIEKGVIYIVPSNAKGSLKVSKNGVIQIANQTTKLYKDLEGKYDLKHTKAGEKDVYYLEKVEEYEHNESYGTRLGENHNYPSSIEKEKVELEAEENNNKSGSLSLTGAVNTYFQNKKSKEKDEKILDLLFKLLRYQIADNKEALSTLDEIISMM